MNYLYQNKTYIILSKWCYPFGGGEEFLLETMYWAYDLGMNCYWISLCDKTNKYFDKLEIECHKFGKFIKIPNGFNKNIIKYWLKLLRPTIVHHQGHLRKEFYEICDDLRIEFLTGFHFWFGGIILNEKTLNINILENSNLHCADNEISYLWNKKYCNYYTVTEFVSECIDKITNYKINDIIYASSSIKKCKIDNNNILNNKYVTMINIHKLKGGEILLYLIKNLSCIPFLVVKTEPGSCQLDKEIERAIQDRNESCIFFESIKSSNDESNFSKKNVPAKCLIIDRVKDPKIIYRQTRILLVPSICDETFCRVVNEGMMNGIPIITTGKGNIKNLVRNSAIIIDESDLKEWSKQIDNLYFNDILLAELSDKSSNTYLIHSEDIAKQQFKTVIGKTINKSKDNNIMIICPWCDQGLGIQSRNYANILKNIYNIIIFSYKPYNANSSIELQKNSSEWEWENIYYSSNDRENIKDYEIIDQIIKYNVGKCILPETCWFRTFEIAKLLRNLDVKCYAIPNIEIVRLDEIYKHHYFYKILCNNYLCKNIFAKYGIDKTEYIGYSQNNQLFYHNPTPYNKNNIIKFLFIGGMNAFSRKQIINVCEAFENLYEINKNITLTCTIQKTNNLEIEDKNKILKYLNHPCFTFIEKHLSYQNIVDLYYQHHISIQVSKHEGLGLGFYEALSTATPVITLDIPPHNEIIKDNINGWTIKCYQGLMEDNTNALIESAYFEPHILSNKLINILNNFNDTYTNIINNLIVDYNLNHHIDIFRHRLLESISY